MEAKDVRDHLPLVIWMQIFSLLPVKSLLIIRSVCKFFLDVINDDEFFPIYLRNSPANLKENRILTLRSRLHGTPYLTHCEVLEHEGNSPSAELKWGETTSFFNNPKWFVAGSVDGLILIMCNTFATLWNPSIRKARQIPWPTTTPNLKFMRVGFGYDESCNDYKLLAVMDHTLPPIVSLEEKEAIAYYPDYPPIIRLKEEESRAWVYSVKSGSWTTVELPGCRHRRETSESVAFKGGLVWIEGVDTGHKYYHHLVRFDFATEKYRYIPTPYPIKKNVWVVNRLVVIDGGSSLAVWGLDSDLVVSLWRMEDGMAWTKMCDVGEGVLQMRGFRNKEMVWEYWTKCPKLKASVYNDGGKVRDGCVEPVEYVDAYVESLVLLN